MEREQLAWIIESLAHRLKDFPKEAVSELFAALDEIERRHHLIEPLSEEQREAIMRGLADVEAGRVITHEELKANWAHRFKDYDADAAGKEALLDAVLRVQKLSGKEQDAFARVLFAILDEPQFDIPPPPATSKRNLSHR